MLHIAIVLSACALVALVSGNNLPACAGAIISSRIVSRFAGTWIAIAGYSLGLMTEGHALRTAFARLMPNSSETMVMIALATGIVVFVLAHVNRVPQSLSQTFAAAILGISAARHAPFDRSFTVTMLSFWVVAPFASIVLIVFLMRWSRHFAGEHDVWRTARRIKVMLLVLSFFGAFVLGANTMGFVYGAMPDDPRMLAMLVLAIIVGSTWFSAGELRRVGQEIVAMRYSNSIVAQFSSIVLLELATLLAVPLSYTVIFTSGVYGAGFSYKSRLMTTKSAKVISRSWVMMLVASFLIGYVATAILTRRTPI
ncbi:MAG TPA: inorganic phosphate transporter [bacterium]|nr:inorganic phosphate transporter [bacterium]